MMEMLGVTITLLVQPGFTQTQQNHHAFRHEENADE